MPDLKRTPRRWEVNWGSESFEGTLHPDADISNDVLAASFSDGISNPEGTPQRLHTVRGTLTLFSPEGRYNPSLDGSWASGRANSPGEKYAESAIRMVYSRNTLAGFEATEQLAMIGVLRDLKQIDRQTARVTIVAINEEALKKRISATEAPSPTDAFADADISELFEVMTLGGRDYPQEAILRGLTFDTPRRRVIDQAAAFLAAWPYPTVTGAIRFFELGAYPETAVGEDFSLLIDSVKIPTESVSDGLDITGVRTSVPYDFGLGPPLPGDYPVPVSRDEWIVGPGQSESRVYNLPQGLELELKTLYTVSDLEDVEGQLAISGLNAGTQVSFVPDPYNFTDPTANETFETYRQAGFDNLSLARPLQSELTDISVELDPIGSSQVRATVRNNPSGASRDIAEWKGTRTFTESQTISVGPHTLWVRSLTYSAIADSQAEALASVQDRMRFNAASRAQDSANELGRAGNYDSWQTLGISYTDNFIESIVAGTQREYFFDTTYRLEITYRNYEVLEVQETGTFTYEAIPQWNWKFTLPLAARVSANPGQTFDTVSGPAEAVAEFGVRRYDEIPRWEDPGNSVSKAHAERVAEILSSPKRLIRFQLPAWDLDAALSQNTILRTNLDISPGQRGDVQLRSVNATFNVSAQVFIARREYQERVGSLPRLSYVAYVIGRPGIIRVLYARAGKTLFGDPLDSYVAPNGWVFPV